MKKNILSTSILVIGISLSLAAHDAELLNAQITSIGDVRELNFEPEVSKEPHQLKLAAAGAHTYPETGTINQNITIHSKHSSLIQNQGMVSQRYYIRYELSCDGHVAVRQGYAVVAPGKTWGETGTMRFVTSKSHPGDYPIVAKTIIEGLDAARHSHQATLSIK